MTCLLLLAACSGDEPDEKKDTVQVPGGNPWEQGDDDDDDNIDVIETSDTGNGLADKCSNLPPLPLQWNTVLMPTSEEFTFDTNGNMINIDDDFDHLLLTPKGGLSTFIAPYDSIELAGVRLLMDGDLAVADEWDGSVNRMSISTGSVVPILAGLPSPNSLAVDQNGVLYIASFGELTRIDPDDPTFLEQLDVIPNADLDGLTFSPDFSKLYFNHDNGGVVGYLEFDGAMNHIATVNFATIDTTGTGELDGMATDECGNVYVVGTNGTILRVRTDGRVEPFVVLTSPGAVYTTSANFGSGFGGWDRDFLYVMNRSGPMFEVYVGLEGRWEAHLPGSPQ